MRHFLRRPVRLPLRAPAAFLLILAGCASTPTVPPMNPAGTPTGQVVPLPPGDSARPLPYPVDVPPGFQAAIAQGTRSATGRPGGSYWQNDARYRLTAHVEPEDRTLRGSADIAYRNNSPDTLFNLHLDLTQNFHAPGAIRFEEAEVTGGVTLHRVAVAGTTLGTEGNGPRYVVFGTRLVMLPPQPVLPGQTVNLDIDFSFTIPQAGAGARMGYGGDHLFFLAYWYPQMVVYDDVVGWHEDPFTGITEFYADFAAYDVTIDVPAGWVVASTGRLTNAAQVLAAPVLERLRLADGSDTAVAILRQGDFATATTAGSNGRLQWHFVADSVRDVAFSMTRQSNWDAMRTAVGDRDGDGRADYTRIDAFWRNTAPLWRNAARYTAHAISFLSQYTGIPYPWPHMTSVEGAEIMGGGMEYPMMTLIGDYTDRGDSALYNVIAHEIAHMWVPMIVSSDERRYTWMDEGTTSFGENIARMDFYPGRNHHLDDQRTYLQIAGTGDEGEIMRRSAYHYSPGAYGIASYMKPASVLVALRAVLGADVFNRAYREFLQRWMYRHPYPWDMWHTFQDVSGRELAWFWRAWYYETWTLDQAVASVTARGGVTDIVIEDRGRVPMPVPILITFQNGQTVRREVPVEHWLAGQRRATVSVDSPAPVIRVEIDADMAFPDVDRGNNVWRR